MQSEFEFIEKIRRCAVSSTAKVGIGDDCAVIPKDSKTDLVITSDLLVEDIDFRLDWTIPEFLGHKALAVSLSDVAAMGAAPLWAMLSIGIPENIWRTDFVEKFYQGWFALAKKFNVALIGGDVSKTPDKIIIDSITAGEVKKNRAVLRSGAMPGDLIFVTGNLGGAAGGLKLLEGGKRFDEKSKNQNQNLIRRQLKPTPQTEIGQILGAKNLATAMIDLSDGLSGDLSHLCRGSQVGAQIYADKIPVDSNLKKAVIQKYKTLAGKNDYLKDEIFLALNGGEDFELLFTVQPKNIFRLEKELKKFSFSRIGEINANSEMIELVGANGTTVLSSEGFRHF